jgi:hypothetical protein
VRALPSTSSAYEIANAAADADLTGRDFDRDGLPMELDEDSDGGGCRDGLEDRNLNGARDGSETDNFDKDDDDCELSLGGRIEMSYGFVTGSPPACTGNVRIRLRFELEPQWGNTPENSRAAVATAYLARTAAYEINTDGCNDVVGGLFDFWRGANVDCNAKGDKKSGMISVGQESSSYVVFLPLQPELGLLLPPDAQLHLDGECVYVDGSRTDQSIDFLGSEVFTAGSGPSCTTSDRFEWGQGPDLLEFCVEPTVCNTGLDADPQTLAECYTNPERHAQIPFSGSLRKLGAILEGADPGGRALPIPVDDAVVRWEVCNGCGDRFLE